MTLISFYHLEKTSLDHALAKLLEKALDQGHRVVVLAESEERVEELNIALWTFEQSSFLPHGTQKEGFSDNQPIYLTARDENPNGADVLVLLDGAASEKLESYGRVLNMFDGHDEKAMEAARDRWLTFQNNGYELTYWQQTKQGGWEKTQ